MALELGRDAIRSELVELGIFGVPVVINNGELEGLEVNLFLGKRIDADQINTAGHHRAGEAGQVQAATVCCSAPDLDVLHASGWIHLVGGRRRKDHKVEGADGYEKTDAELSRGAQNPRIFGDVVRREGVVCAEQRL